MVFRRRAVVFRCPAVDFRWRGVVGRICPAREGSPRRRHPDTAHERKDLPRAGTRPSAKASRHGTQAKGFAPRRNAPHGEGLPTQRTSERICPAQKRSPRRRPTDTAHGRKNLPAQEHAPRRRPPDTAHERKDLPRGVHVRPKCRRTAGRPRPTDSRKNTPSAGSHPRGRGRCRVHSPKKIRLLHETQLFYGESHVGSPQIFSSFPSVDRCVAREQNPVPPVAPHRGSGHRGLRRDGEMHHGFGEMVRRFGECPRGGKSLPRGGNAWPRGGGRYCPGLRCFGERFHRRCRANPDACRGRRCSRGWDDLGRRAFRCSRPTFRNRRRSGEKNFRAPHCSRGQDDLGRRAFRCSRPTFRNRRRSGEKDFHAPRCFGGHNDLGRRPFRSSRPTFRNRRRSGEKNFRGPRCSRGHNDLGRRPFRCSRPTFRNRRRSGEKNFRGPRCSRG